ncbi:MAG: succinate-semialdehyde dehydrogenase [Alphaproteobacteria bacterium]|jgi:succinate-semialdehyde dehydrogenase/glutarate-semialdehyde dehydrogenase|nr:succinate-semialdehyde dehydrogenase [Alphaproteobacteria bacterium]
MPGAAVQIIDVVAQLNLKDSKLFRQLGYIDGAWTAAEGGRILEVNNPATGDIIGTIPNMGAAETKKAIDAASKALEGWKTMLAADRAKILKKWADLQLENIDDLAKILTTEQGKPLAQAKAEIQSGIDYVVWMAEEGRRVYGDVIPTHNKTHRLVTLKQPVGVCAMITPWNFPSSMITRKTGPALAAGCTVVMKPSEFTPFSALALAELAERAGIPKGVLNIVIGEAQPIGKEMTDNPTVKKLSFTGSTAVGKILLTQCAASVKKVSMELGGNAPFIVFDDADIDAAVTGAIASKFRNAGQTCVCANRIFVQEGIYDAFAQKFTEAVAKMKVGNGLEEGVEIGPMINVKGMEKVEQHLTDATQKGGKVTTGGKRHKLGESFFEPTVVRDATTEMKFFREETFGPLAPLFKFKTDDDVIKMANDTEYGLAAYFYSNNMARIWRVGEALEYGMVGVNSVAIVAAQAPFGGWKQSGIGTEGSKYGIEDYLEIKLLSLGGL